MRRRRRGPQLLVIALAAMALVCCRATPVFADGDPASDLLLVQNAFFPYQPKVSSSLERTLEGTLASVARATHVPLKVAIIRTPTDLGLEPQFFGHPQAYAAFLDREISFNSSPALITVMPTGFGVIPARYAPALAHVHVDTAHGSDGMTRSALAAVLAVSHYLGHSVRSTEASAATSSSSSSPGLFVFAVPVGLLVIAGLLLRMRRSTRSRT